MILLISEWYNEKGVEFDVSHKVLKYIRKVLDENVVKDLDTDFVDYKDFYLNLVIATSKKTKELEVRGPEIKKRQKMIDYGLWLPFKKITRTNKYLEDFISYLFEAFKIVFTNYNVDIQKIETLKEEIKREVINNSDYQ